MALEWGLDQDAAIALQPGSVANLGLQAGFWGDQTGQAVPSGGAQQIRWELSPQGWAGDLRSTLRLKWALPGVLEIGAPPGSWGDAALRLTSVWQPAPGSPPGPAYSASVTVVVLVPRYAPGAPQAGAIDGYHLGAYPSGCVPPLWFTPVPDAAEGHYLTPMFRLGHVTCAQPADAPIKYTVLDYAILEKLEKLQRVLDRVCPGAVIARQEHHGFRSPTHNARVGGAARSRHMWGEAFDFRVTQGDSDRLADLSGDGVVNVSDGIFLRGVVRDMEGRGEVRTGGCGVYENSHNGHRTLSFHLDTRGQATDWTQRAGD